MAKQATKKVYNTFVKGLITEAGPLTFPEHASLDEDNCVLYRKGDRSRRPGFEFESGYQTVGSDITLADIAQYGFSEFEWKNANNDTESNFLVIQQGLTLYFYDLGSSVISGGVKSFTVDLTSYVAPGASADDARALAISMTSGKGYLFGTGEFIEPFVVRYNSDTDTVTTNKIYVLIRDLEGLDDGLAPDEELTTLSAAHEYNLKNQGWTHRASGSSTVSVTQYGRGGVFSATAKSNYNAPAQTVITTYRNTIGRYPGNNKEWWVGKGTDQVFDPAVLNRSYWGTTLAPKGHYIVDAFYIDRSAVSGVAGLSVVSTHERPLAISFFSGRVWYLSGDTVYFSQVLNKTGSNVGFCHQEADPTAENISDLIATDGGVIPIPELGRGVELRPSGSGILVFGTAGVWYISGTTAGFTATDISVSKVAKIGTDSPKSIVEAEKVLYWFSKTGIQALKSGSDMLSFEQDNISLNTIQSYYNEHITEYIRKDVKGVYDPVNSTIQWLFRSDELGSNFFYDRILNLDLSLQAFYPWSLTGENVFITGVFKSSSILNTTTTEDVVDASDVVVTNSLGASVTIDTLVTTARPTFLKYIVRFNVTDTLYRATFAQCDNSDYVDWDVYSAGAGIEYNSFVETGYELVQTPTQKKQTPYIYCYFKQTETAYVLDGADYVLSGQSSCTLQTKWDWSNSATSNKWSREVEVYRIKRLPPLDEFDLTLDTGFPVVVTKNKVRGSGRAITFKFSCSDRERNFDLLGWAVDVDVNMMGSN